MPGTELQPGDRVVVEAERGHPRRRRGRRGRGVGRRVGDHRRIGAGDPRIRWRPQRRDRRHQGAVGPHRGPDHVEARRDVHRPDDRARRGRAAPEDAERDRPEHPAREPHDRLPAGDRHAAADRDLLGRQADRDRPGGPARVPDPDHDRRAAVGDRHRRDGPARAAQRAGDVGARRRGRRRRQHAAARQDRHDHPREPAGRRVPPGARRHGGGARGRRADHEPRRRDPRGPFDRRAGEGAVRAARP